MALTSAQRDLKHTEFKLGDAKVRGNSPATQDLWRALQKRAATSPGTPERAEADKRVATAEGVLGY